MGAKKIHSGYFTGNEEVFWCCRRIRDAGNQLKAIAHGYEEGSVKASFASFSNLATSSVRWCMDAAASRLSSDMSKQRRLSECLRASL